MARSAPRSTPAPVLVWFRDDLRVADNPALAAAARGGAPLIVVYVFDEESPGLRAPGGASRWWLAGSLRALDAALQKRGARLTLRRGAAADVIPNIVAETGAATVYWNRRHDPAAAAIDRDTAESLKARGIAVHAFQASLLHAPEDARTRAGHPFSVFTPFLRHLRSLDPPRKPLPAPRALNGAPAIAGDQLDDWRLEPRAPDWAAGFSQVWTRGEEAAQQTLAAFADATLAGYAATRDQPGRSGTSRLSPHLRFGEVSPFQVWHAVQAAREAREGEARSLTADADKFIAELVWREFCYHLLAEHRDLASRNVQARFDAFPWRNDAAALRAWQRGETGYPIVDAGMRELWATGWMHNRVRLIAASFLAKHLLLDWRAGERWFWDTLVDADPANNPANWQWVAGSGADAAPYFRIFNPALQGQKFDAAGTYVQRWVPELAHLPDKVIHAPETASAALLADAGVSLGKTYPVPIVEHKTARARALAAFAEVKERGR